MTSPLATLSESEINAVVGHPLQRAAYPVVGELISDLRRCETPADYDEFQRILFQQVWAIETQRGAISKVRKRLRRGESLPADAPSLPDGRSNSDPEAWRLESLAHERVWRQLRSVGDALAWRVSGFDRRYILALSHNSSPGPMAGKAGLPWELGAVEELWKERGHFSLLHDLTNCLRIGDLTEFTTDGQRLLLEVKKRARQNAAQTARMSAAIAAVNEGAPLPGASERLVTVDVDFATHLSCMRDAVTMAREHGVVGMKVPGGRALTAAHLPTMASNRDRRPDEWIQMMQRTRVGAIKRAGIADDDHHLNMFTADSAARSPATVPFGVYPLPPEDCAGLICDFVVVEIIMAPNALFDVAARYGMRAEMLLPNGSGELGPTQPMFRLHRRNRALVVHSAVTVQLLAEMVAIDPFVEGLSLLLDHDRPLGSPVLTFRNEASVWR